MHDSSAGESAAPPSLLQAVLETTADAVVEQDLEGRVVTWNRAATRILGRSDSDMLGRPFEELLDEGGGDVWAPMLADVQRGERVRVPRAVLRRPDGLAVHGAIAVFPTYDDEGHINGSCLVIQDRGERHIARGTLPDSDQRVRRSEALAGSGSFVIDGAAGPEQWSGGMYALFGRVPGDFDGTREAHLALVDDEHRAVVAAAFETVLTAGASTELDHVTVVDGRPVWVFLALEPARDDGGRVTGVRGVCQDITARKEAEASARAALALEQRANDELRELDALKDEFLATVSHELRTPLTSIIGFAGVLRKTAPELSAYVEPIARNGTDMARMIEKLLDYSRLQAGHVPLAPETVDLSTEVEALIAPHADAVGGQRFVNDVPTDLRIVTDRDALERVLGNLIGNASRYSGAGSIIRVRAEPDGDGGTLITVSDNGPGIPVEHQQRLFDRFYQVPGAGSRRGTGVGLAIVREYVRQQGGSVWCESSEGAGAAFRVRLPKPREELR
jgi:PAS domain S-box-containing protein